MCNSTTTISIPLSKTGENAGLYSALIDECDSDFALFNWTVKKFANTEYAYKGVRQGGKRVGSVYLHRAIMAKIMGRELEKSEDVDHINGNGLDNRRCNLRLATRQQNMMNRRVSRDNSSGYKGVSWHDGNGKFHARIRVAGKRIHLGYYDDPAEAYAAYCAAAKIHHGEYARYE